MYPDSVYQIANNVIRIRVFLSGLTIRITVYQTLINITETHTVLHGASFYLVPPGKGQPPEPLLAGRKTVQNSVWGVVWGVGCGTVPRSVLGSVLFDYRDSVLHCPTLLRFMKLFFCDICPGLTLLTSLDRVRVQGDGETRVDLTT